MPFFNLPPRPLDEARCMEPHLPLKNMYSLEAWSNIAIRINLQIVPAVALQLLLRWQQLGLLGELVCGGGSGNASFPANQQEATLRVSLCMQSKNNCRRTLSPHSLALHALHACTHACSVPPYHRTANHNALILDQDIQHRHFWSVRVHGLHHIQKLRQGALPCRNHRDAEI